MAETNWKHRLILVIPASAQPGANAVHTLHWPGGDAERLTFNVPLSPTGAEPPTHFATHTSVTDALWLALRDLLDGGLYPGMAWYRLDREDARLLETNSPTVTLGEPLPFAAALYDLGLARIRTEDNDGI